MDACSVVIGTGGGNVVAETAAARRPLVCLPQERPFDEQTLLAAALERLEVAVVSTAWPAPGDWRALLARAERADMSRWRLLHDGHGAPRAAALVREVAESAWPVAV